MLLPAAAVFAAALQAAVAPQAPAAAASKPVAAKAEKKVCTLEDEPGSNFQRRVCRTDAEAQQARDDANKQVSAGATITRGH